MSKTGFDFKKNLVNVSDEYTCLCFENESYCVPLKPAERMAFTYLVTGCAYFVLFFTFD